MMPTVTINWGPWGEAGMAAVGTKAHQLSLENGEMPLTNAQGLSCLATVLFMLEQNHAPMQFACCHCDWPRTPWQGLPLLMHVSSSVENSFDQQDDAAYTAEDHGQPKTNGSSSSSTTTSSSPGVQAQDSAVVVFLKDRVPRWELDQQLSEVGLDSLDMVRDYTQPKPLTVYYFYASLRRWRPGTRSTSNLRHI